MEQGKARVTEALPWVLLTYTHLDWAWLVDQVRLANCQNRLGFLLSRSTGDIDVEVRPRHAASWLVQTAGIDSPLTLFAGDVRILANTRGEVRVDSKLSRDGDVRGSAAAG